MKTFKVNDSNDFSIDLSGNFTQIDGVQAIIQSCGHATKAQLGEMIYAVDRGMPNFQVIWSGSPNLAQFEAALRKTILAVEGVISIEDLAIEIKKNTIAYTATIKTKYGVGELNGGI